MHKGTLTVHHVILLSDAFSNTRLTATLLPIITTFLTAGAMMSNSDAGKSLVSLSFVGRRLGGSLFKPILNPVGHHSTKLTLLFCLSHWTVALASLDLISPR